MNRCLVVGEKDRQLPNPARPGVVQRACGLDAIPAHGSTLETEAVPAPAAIAPKLGRSCPANRSGTVPGLCPVGRYRSAMPRSRLRFLARGVLFVVLAIGLLGIAVAAATAREWAVAVAAAVLAAWMADLALRDLGVRRSRA